MTALINIKCLKKFQPKEIEFGFTQDDESFYLEWEDGEMAITEKEFHDELLTAKSLKLLEQNLKWKQ